MQRVFPSCNCMGSAGCSPSFPVNDQLVKRLFSRTFFCFPKPNLLTPSLYIIKAAGTRCGSFLEHESTFKIPQLDQNVRHVYLPSASATENENPLYPGFSGLCCTRSKNSCIKLTFQGYQLFLNTQIFHNPNKRFLVRLQGIARTQFPTNRNCAPEFPTFEEIAEVSYPEVQWNSLALEEPP